jgi:serine protease Do
VRRSISDFDELDGPAVVYYAAYCVSIKRPFVTNLRDSNRQSDTAGAKGEGQVSSATSAVARCCAIALLCLLARVVPAATLTPELQQAIRASTFEVVMKKPDKDSVSYEKPLPLELLPYIERTDAYRAVGTAFALGHNTYVTAAHVLLAGVDSQFGMPALRRADGTVFAIDQIQKFSAYQDFVVFSLQKDPAPAGFIVNQAPKLDDPVLAVGNALGEGIVIRDGLYTSATAEEQDNRWKWIRFSAAASPGNSGGPLLDIDGQVIGIVIGKSPNENLNYSLPISQVLAAPDHKARFDQRALIGLPFLHGTQTYAYQDSFELPLAWPEFARAYQAVIVRHEQNSRAALLKSYADTLFPKGSGTESVLYAPEANDYRPRLIAQQDDGRWNAIEPDYNLTDLSGDGSVSTAGAAGGSLLRLVRPDHALDDGFYADSKAFMDLALKGLNLHRTVGPDQVRVTSLGPALSDTIYVDHYGRKWQQRVWAVPFMDVYLVCLLLPTPDGYSGLINYAPSNAKVAAEERVRLLADQFDVSFSGTLAQWRAYLARRALLPTGLEEVKLESMPEWTLRTRRFVSSVPQTLVALSEQSLLNLTFGFFPEGGRVVWDIEDVWWNHDQQQKNALGIWRRLRPPKTAKLELRSEFDNMRERSSPYDSQYSRDSASTFVISTIKDVPGKQAGLVASELLYGLTLRTDSLPAQMGALATQRLIPTLQVLESGIGEDIVPAQGQVSSSHPQFDTQVLAMQKMATMSNSSFGRDGRGRLMSDEMNTLIAAARAQLGASGASEEQVVFDLAQHSTVLWNYWRESARLRHQRELWSSFLVNNRRPPDTPHSELVLSDEQALVQMFHSGVPSEAWTEKVVRLREALEQERLQSTLQMVLTEADYHPRVSPCPAAAPASSTTDQAQIVPPKHGPDEFYPVESRQQEEQGRVILSVRVSSAGCGSSVAIAMSSGSAPLDDAALRYFETMEFLPAQVRGVPIGAQKALAVAFKLR